MKFPSIKNLAEELKLMSANVEGECDVRLQVLYNEWYIHSGNASFDTNHRGFWGCSSVPGVVNGKVSRFNSRNVARDLINQVKEDYYANEG